MSSLSLEGQQQLGLSTLRRIDHPKLSSSIGFESLSTGTAFLMRYTASYQVIGLLIFQELYQKIFQPILTR
jgi:hypothetical protein